jgi:error-prone DNA polymerase
MMNAIVNPATFEHFKFEVLGEPNILIDGILQNQDGVINVRAGRITALSHAPAPASHDFY